MRRAGVASLLIALFALAGASVAPTRGVDGPQRASIVWQVRGDRTSHVVRNTRPRGVAFTASHAAVTAASGVDYRCTPVRHALFQRPPPQI